MNSRLSIVLGSWSLLLGLCVVGCVPPKPEPVPVQGQVRAGKSLRVLGVKFWPQGQGGPAVEALCGPRGDFKLACPPGTYKVTLLPYGGGGESGPENVHANLPAVYQDPMQTPFTVDVPPGGTNKVELRVP